MYANHWFIVLRILGHSKFWITVLRFSKFKTRVLGNLWGVALYLHCHKLVRGINSTILVTYKIHTWIILQQVQCNERYWGQTRAAAKPAPWSDNTLARHDQDNLDDHFRPFVNTHQFCYSFVIVEPFDYAELFNRRQFLLLLYKR